MTKIYLIDASPYIFRAYYSIPPTLRTPEGAPANAIYGYTAFLLDLLKREEPSHIAIAFDGSLTTSFRNHIFPEYKAQRKLPDAELEAQLGACYEVTEALGFRGFIDKEYEADDIIGSILTWVAGKDHSFVVVSGDKDLAQLVNDSTILWDYAKDRRLDEKAVSEHFGVCANQIVDLLALAGDAIDNIPGVKGIGMKTACSLLREFGSLEEIYRQIDRMSELPLRGAAAIQSRLLQGKEAAFLSKRLASIAIDMPLKTSMSELRYAGAHEEKTLALFDRLGFAKIRERVTKWQR